jgi:hypothetical protein
MVGEAGINLKGLACASRRFPQFFQIMQIMPQIMQITQIYLLQHINIYKDV